MLRLNTKTKIKPEEVMTKALAFFGPRGYELEVIEQDDDFAYFKGGGGGVEIAVSKEDKVTSVEMVTREWEYQVKEFARSIKK